MNIFFGLQRVHAGRTICSSILLFKGSEELPVTTMRYAGLASIVRMIREPFCRG
jgi:hypothetical protein